jgi:hypothetical protein
MFNLNQFKLTVANLFADKAERHVTLAALIGDGLESAAIAWLVNGSSSLADALTVITANSSKTSIARKLRATIKAIEFQFSNGEKVWATLNGANLVLASDLIGGNSPRVKSELVAREASCVAFGDLVRNSIAESFAPVEADSNADPLKSWGIKAEEGSIKAAIIRIAKADDTQLADALDRVRILYGTLQSALDVRKEAAAVEAAAVEAATVEAAAREEAIRDQLRAELREQMIRQEIGQIANSKIGELKAA